MKTKLVKIEMYVTNFDGLINDGEIQWHYLLREGLNRGVLNNSVFISSLEEREIEWDDGLIINKLDATQEDYAEYFSLQEKKCCL